MQQPPPGILKTILHHKAKEIEHSMARCSLKEMTRRAAEAPAPRGFVTAIQERIAEGKPAVIAELKRASPSKGIIREHYNPAELASAYAKAGATCLSVLTDREYFKGSDEHLREARSACALPILRKDFVIHPYQVYEARLIGADCILLIVAGLEDNQMQELASLAIEQGLDTLVEVHNREELERGLMLRTPLIGINNRDLHTFKTDIQTTIDLLIDVFHDRTVVAESGIQARDDVALMRRHGVNAFLVGEAFMAAADPGAKLQELFNM